ncbi:hypothetical protein DET49_13230 [Salegentibacter sp. 24]|uniref:hypothetical protein n=1 Tax=Salegentibacter sp. 24 TaxID=2183986 RepID=UPI00105C959C|nr:hypothetical protein [Salegentibacter sp. 24]TDN80389.1 hypothetical protein DET49_13230 [Salegentibacter sp. 24]
MNLDFYNEEEFDKIFLSSSLSLLLKIEKNNSPNSLQRIKFHKLEKLARDLDNYNNGEIVRKEKKLFINYLKTIQSKSVSDLTLKELLELERDYLLPSIDGKLREIGYTTRNAWLIASIMVLPLDVFLLYFIGQYFFYIPVFSLYIAISSLVDRRKAKRENKLW